MEQEVENNNKITINSKVLLKAHNSSNVEIMLLYEWRAQRGGLMVVFTRRKELCDVVQCRQWVVGGGKGASAGAEGIHYLFIASTFISSIYLHFMKQMNSKFFLNSNLASPRHLPSRAHSTSDNPTARSFFYLDGREEDVMTWTAGRLCLFDGTHIIIGALLIINTRVIMHFISSAHWNIPLLVVLGLDEWRGAILELWRGKGKGWCVRSPSER